jgi:tRNA1Val (adenine37-N6)-methyltransferase
VKIAQYKDGFRYTSDTMFLWNFALAFVKKGRMLEVGGGSGILGLLLKRERDIELTIVEKEPKMAKLCTINAVNNEFDVSVVCKDFLEYEERGFDYIVSNPPFYPTRVQKSENDSLLASRYADVLPLSEFLQKAKKLLKPNGEIIFCYDARELLAVVSEAAKLKGAALTHIRLVHAKADKPAKLALFRIKNSSRAHLEILPPLIVMDGTDYMGEAKAIFAKAACDSVDI